MIDNTADPFSKLDEAISSPESNAQLDKAQETFSELLNLTRRALRAEADHDYSLFSLLAVTVGDITAEMSRDDLATVMHGAISVLALMQEGLE